MTSANDNAPSHTDLLSYAARHPIDAACMVVVIGLALALVMKAADL